ncbi:MAG: diadenylate cyclase [Archaeoglobaceae archaeon]|nr:diadenylate cyclase [Archaeoglobaceae archaeon]MCX8151700.1 diadenylate cyclase [Archaeoglobaceae archaeon]MDW8013022.1 diadenylate cyclase [Archaeoglobaceae archaeon]
MLKILLDSAKELAEKLEIDKIVVITKSEAEKDPALVFAPKNYAILLDTVLRQVENKADKFIFEGITYLQGVKEYVASLFYLKGIESKKSLVVVDLESLKALSIFDLESCSFLRAIERCAERVDPEAFRSVLRVAMNLAFKGREGKKIGTAFIMGDVEEVLNRSTQLVLNPFFGHKESDRDIKNPEIWESVMEFAQIDGVFVLDEKGIIVSAGRYIEVPSKNLNFNLGLGGRHLACAAITKETKAIAIVVSETGGDIRVYKDGEEILKVQSILY